ncbi:hypothetical protein [Aureispira anguillae]|uniref:Uncharacterized protein n=1 Tax=Aureispira anguillae TaxID=2864201 RepID=A0A915YI28_9BACT|nr:hypothetical protein [Aureispira anguillae]BDS13588.1 hypothetical protein AsAng_0043270 [Aureispira anguillae]
MKVEIFLVAICACLMFFSCKKDTDQVEPEPSTENDYVPLNVGNYWVYQMYAQNANGDWHPTGQLDSIHIGEDTIMNGETYYVQSQYSGRQFRKVDYLRYDDDQLMNHLGEVLYSAKISTTPIVTDRITLTPSSDFFTVDYATVGGFSTIQAGGTIFSDCIDFLGKVNLVENGQTVPKPDVHTYYAKGVGRVQSLSYTFLSETPVKIDLIRYHIRH